VRKNAGVLAIAESEKVRLAEVLLPDHGMANNLRPASAHLDARRGYNFLHISRAYVLIIKSLKKDVRILFSR
jgi:hypothetical protein